MTAPIQCNHQIMLENINTAFVENENHGLKRLKRKHSFLIGISLISKVLAMWMWMGTEKISWVLTHLDDTWHMVSHGGQILVYNYY